MKKLCWVFVLPMLALLTGWASRTAPLDPDLLRRAEQEYQAKKQRVPDSRNLTIIDYRKPITACRLFVYDRVAKRVVLASRVSHAFKTGWLYPRSFSNVNGSEKSCTGSFVTGAAYLGKYGYALRVKGLDTSNSNTLSRAIVFHSVPFIGFPYSAGCFATSVNTELINKIKGGSFVYVAQ